MSGYSQVIKTGRYLLGKDNMKIKKKQMVHYITMSLPICTIPLLFVIVKQ